MLVHMVQVICIDIQCFICTCTDNLNHMYSQNVEVYVSAKDISHQHRLTMFHMLCCADDLHHMHSQNMKVYVSTDDISHLHRQHV